MEYELHLMVTDLGVTPSSLSPMRMTPARITYPPMIVTENYRRKSSVNLGLFNFTDRPMILRAGISEYHSAASQIPGQNGG